MRFHGRFWGAFANQAPDSLINEGAGGGFLQDTIAGSLVTLRNSFSVQSGAARAGVGAAAARTPAGEDPAAERSRDAMDGGGGRDEGLALPEVGLPDPGHRAPAVAGGQLRCLRCVSP